MGRESDLVRGGRITSEECSSRSRWHEGSDLEIGHLHRAEVNSAVDPRERHVLDLICASPATRIHTHTPLLTLSRSFPPVQPDSTSSSRAPRNAGGTRFRTVPADPYQLSPARRTRVQSSITPPSRVLTTTTKYSCASRKGRSG